MLQLIKPMSKVNMGECRYCRTQLYIFEMESFMTALDKNGYPICHEPIKYKTVSYCPECHDEREVTRDGMRYVPDSRLLRICREIEKEQMLNKILNNTNPFGKGE